MGSTSTTEWADPIVQEMSTLFEQGMSHGRIAQKLNEAFGLHLTRNAIIGKARRLQLDRPMQEQSGVNRKRLEAEGLYLRSGGVSGARKKRERTYSVTELKAPEGRGLRLEDLLPFKRDASTSCRYPIGVSEEHGREMFCGEPTHRGSWCPYHCEFVYRGGRFASTG